LAADGDWYLQLDDEEIKVKNLKLQNRPNCDHDYDSSSLEVAYAGKICQLAFLSYVEYLLSWYLLKINHLHYFFNNISSLLCLTFFTFGMSKLLCTEDSVLGPVVISDIMGGSNNLLEVLVNFASEDRPL